MTKDQLAAQLNGREYGEEITSLEATAAKEHGIVVVFGYSDDNIEFRGAIEDEYGCGESSKFYLHRGGLLIDPSQGDCEHCAERTAKLANQCATIAGIWDQGGYSWQYETAIPHATFDIMEGEEKYCRGIVFEMADLPILR